jgi:uncharacterized membrane protein
MTALLLVLGAVVFVAVMRVWWESAGTAIAEDTHDEDLMEESSRGMNVAMAVALVAFVAVLLVAALGGAL